MSLQRNPHSECGRTEQILCQFFLKTLHTILDCRIPSLYCKDRLRESTLRKREKWFNLALGEPPPSLENLNLWHRNIGDPVIIDVIACRESTNSDLAGDRYGEHAETTVERWIIQNELIGMVSQTTEGAAAYKKMYKKSIILLRSVYYTLRLLPAFRVFRQLISTSQSYNFHLRYKISSFSVPFTRAEEEFMKIYNFVPVDNPFGRISVSVTYRSVLSDLILEPSRSLPPQIITDYVGSPAADPLKPFPSDQRTAWATLMPLTACHSPSSPLQRPHSWTSGLNRQTSTSKYSHCASPPTHSPSSPQNARTTLPCRSISDRRDLGSDDHLQSPPVSLSASPSPSPPAYLFSSNSSLHSPSRSETSPVSIPLSVSCKSRKYLTTSSSDPNKLFLPPPSPKSLKVDNSAASTSESSKLFKKMDMYSGNANLHGQSGARVVKDSREDSGRFSGTVSSSNSPRFGFPRSLSRLSSPDDLDDTEFTCPFAVDDIDIAEGQPRFSGRESPGSASFHALASPRTSQDAAVGVLVHILRTAPPLRQDASCFSQSVQDHTIRTPGLLASRTASDAIEELQSYKAMKDMLLSQSEMQLWQISK